MNISENIFTHYVSAATGPDGYGIFPMIADDIEIMKQEVSSMLGETLYGKLAEAQGDELSPLWFVCNNVERYICLAAFERAIPSLDLVLTPTGFGVVSNQNVAPASADRVARLLRKVRDMKESALDLLLYSLRGNEDWCDTDEANKWFGSLIWSSALMRNFGYPGEYRTKMEELRPQIDAAESSLIKLVSPEFHAELTAHERRKSAEATDETAIRLCRSYIYAFVAGDPSHVVMVKNSLLTYLDNCIEHFATYAASSAYRANHFNHYENKKEDSGFFFGG